ncbi:MAG: PCP reductase family protein [Planctomycetota bacterium]
MLFVLAAVLRAGFVFATADGAGLHSPLFKGDAPLWLDYAHALRTGSSFSAELDLPFRPPGTAWLLASVWDGTVAGLPTMRFVWLLLSAALAPLTFLWALRFGSDAAMVAGSILAVAGGSIQLGSTVTSEVPACVLTLGALLIARRIEDRPGPLWAIALGGVLGLSALLRAEQVLITVLLLAWTARRAQRGGGAGRLRDPVIAGAVFVLVLLPWQLEVHRRLQDFDERVSPALPSRSMAWDAGSLARLERVPGFARAATQRFIEATLRHRGEREVTLDGLRCVDEAFGCWPEPLSTWSLIALYGPLNFALANHEGAEGGFDRSLLDRAPPLTGGRERFDPQWLRSLPADGALALAYPPHVQLVRDGYGVGLSWIRSHPLDAATLFARKLWITFAGVATGLGATQFPLGASGVRRRVDLTVAEGTLATLWRLLWAATCVVGLVRGWRRPGSGPVLLWLCAGLCTSAAFFGYARLGAVLLPPFAVLTGLAVQGTGRTARAVGVLLLVAVVIADGFRWLSPPRYLVDGVEVHEVEPFPPLAHQVRHVEVR